MDKDIICSNPSCKTPLLRFRRNKITALKDIKLRKDSEGNGVIKCPKCGAESPMSMDDSKRL
jgi:hypothetical protein